MSRVVSLVRPPVRRAAAVAVSSLLLAGALGAPVVAEDLPACSADRLHDCRLPDWSETALRDLPSLFGEVEPVVWVDDPSGDVTTGGLDILGVGLGRVEVTDATSIRESEQLLKLGKPKKAVRKGSAVLVRIVLDRPLDQVEGPHAGVHLATDIKGSRSDNAPSGVAAPDHPFAGTDDIYSVTWASTTGLTKLLDSDLIKGWYKDKDQFAAAWAAPNVLDVLIRPQLFGDDFRVISHVGGADGGYDTASLGVGAIPVDGRVGLIPDCIEGSISDAPFLVKRLVENGQTLRNVEAPASWRGGAAVPVDDEVRAALGDLITAADEDGDGRIGIDAKVNLFEEGVVIQQRPQLELALDGDRALLGLELGLTRRGFNVLRDFELASTGDADLDAWLERATDSLKEYMPPFRSTKKPGLVAGEGIGSCIPWLEPVPEPEPEPSPEAVDDQPVDDAPDA